MIELWNKVKDVVTWFTWIVTAKYQYLTWCDRLQVTPSAEDKDKYGTDSMAYDINSLVKVDDGVSVHFKTEKPKEIKKWWPEVYRTKNMK